MHTLGWILVGVPVIVLAGATIYILYIAVVEMLLNFTAKDWMIFACLVMLFMSFVVGIILLTDTPVGSPRASQDVSCASAHSEWHP